MNPNKLLRDVASQTLTHIPLDQLASATWILEDLSIGSGDASRILASGAATVATWSLTTTAAAGASQFDYRKITVSSTTGASIGAPAVVTAPDGSKEMITVAGVSSGVYIRTETPLSGDYPIGSTVKGVLISASIPDSVGQDASLFDGEKKIRIVWTYTLGGALHKVPVPIELGRFTESDFEFGRVLARFRTLYPDVTQRLPNAMDLSKVIVALSEDIMAELAAKKIHGERFLAGPQGTQLLTAKLVAHLADTGWSPLDNKDDPGGFAQRAHREFKRILDNLTIGEPGYGVTETSVDNDVAASGPGSVNYRPFTLAL